MGGGGGNARRRGGGLRKGRGYLFMMDKRAGERGQFQSRVEGVVGGGGREECTCDNGGSRRGGNRASSDFLFVCAKSER